MTALGWMPCGCFCGGKKSGSTLATAIRVFGTRMRTFFDDVKAPATRMAVAELFFQQPKSRFLSRRKSGRRL
jgi:hypothetical protein